MRRGSTWFLGVCTLCLLPGTAFADVAFPARLDVAESEPGVYDVSFTLPIIEGRKLRAEPLLPPTCTEMGERQSGLSAGGLTITWSVQCDPASLAGEAIVVQGLLGTQTDLAFTLTTLDGRSFSQILRPSRPGFLVPQPPSVVALALSAALEGARSTLRHPGLWVLFCVVALAGSRFRELGAAAAVFALGCFAALWLESRVWLEVTPGTRDLILWASVIPPALQLTGEIGWRSWLRPLWPFALLLGLLFGGAGPETLSSEGLSTTEQLLALLLFAAGAGIAVLLMVSVGRQLAAVLDLVRDGRWRETGLRTLGTVGGALAVGFALALLVGMALTTGSGPRQSLEFLLLAAVAAPTVARAGRAGDRAFMVFAGLAAVGAAAGMLGLALPGAALLVLGPLIVLAGALALGRPFPSPWALGLACLGATASAWSAALALMENVSRAPAVTVGLVLVAVCIFYAALSVARSLDTEKLPTPIRLAVGCVAVIAVLWRVGEYRRWFDLEVATEAALGLARLPLLAMACAALAIMLWPRRRRVAQELGLEKEQRSWHWVALGAALLVVPYGTVAVPNPFFEPHAPRGADAGRVLTRVLSDTYHAFNLADEEELYDTLAANVTGDLVDDLYLDGRRRLTAGTREGTRVTVRDVSVVGVGEPFGGASAEEGFSYDCSWAVVARVQHLQHIHHRRNLYNGVLTLQSESGRWKISGVELVSEDRAVVPWNPT